MPGGVSIVGLKGNNCQRVFVMRFIIIDNNSNCF